MDAEAHIRSKTLASYAEHGFGMYLVELKANGSPIGVCGLVKRETLPEPDIGFALLEQHWGRGYAEEAARAVLKHAFSQLRLIRLLGITTPSNQRSGRLLEKLGFQLQGVVKLGEETLKLYAVAAQAGDPASADLRRLLEVPQD